MNWLVTGAGGFVGGHMARGLARRGHSVLALSRSAGRLETLASSHDAITPVALDIRAIDDFVPAQPVDGIVHCAAASPADTPLASVMQEVNAHGSRLLAAWSARLKVPFFVHVSSVSVYGRAQGRINEESPIVEPDAYGISKRMAEQEIAHARQGLSSVSLRLPGVLGKGAHNIWLSGVMDTLKNGKELTYYHKDMPFNNAVHVDDMLAFILALSAQPGTTHRLFTLGAGSTLPVGDVLNHMKRLLSSASPLTEQPAGKPGFYIDCTRAQKAGYAPMTIEDMLKRYVHESVTAADQP